MTILFFSSLFYFDILCHHPEFPKISQSTSLKTTGGSDVENFKTAFDEVKAKLGELKTKKLNLKQNRTSDTPAKKPKKRGRKPKHQMSKTIKTTRKKKLAPTIRITRNKSHRRRPSLECLL
jgi:hypothetical protein